jgi:hypothetical protein
MPEKNTDYYRSVERWLKLLDIGEMESAWSYVSKQVSDWETFAQFENAIRQIRDPRGNMVRREYWSRAFMDTSHLPDGLYAYIILQTHFENNKTGVFEHVLIVKQYEKWWIVAYKIE